MKILITIFFSLYSLSTFAGGVSKEDFDKIIDTIQNTFSPYVEERGATLKIEKHWEDDMVNAFSNRKDPKIYKITIMGGMARHEAMTKDGLTLITCHELGHHLGGAPKMPNYKWSSIEGQADYWGAMKCLKKLFAADDNVALMKNENIPERVSSECNKVYSDKNDQAICERIALAGIAASKVFITVRDLDELVDINVKDTSVVKETDPHHPVPQCRLDTFMAAALCPHSVNDLASDSEEQIGNCSILNGDSVGVRPACWFSTK